MRPELRASTRIDIAKAYLDAGDAKTALSWVEQAQNENGSDKLLLAIYRELGDQDKAAEVAWQTFRRCHCDYYLADLLSVIGQDQREQVVADETQIILSSGHFSNIDVEFLVTVGRIDEAERYMLDNANKLDGCSYSSLLTIARSMESNNRWLIASVIYRALLDSILARGYAKAYHHGIDYLRSLDNLAGNISDWGEFSDHITYKTSLRKAHARKSSFWPVYDRG